MIAVLLFIVIYVVGIGIAIQVSFVKSRYKEKIRLEKWLPIKTIICAKLNLLDFDVKIVALEQYKKKYPNWSHEIYQLEIDAHRLYYQTI